VEITVSRRAPILGILGLVLMTFGLLAHWMTRNPAESWFAFSWYALAHLVAGALCLIAYFAGGSASIGEFVRQRSTRYGVNALVYSVLFVAVVVMLNFLGARYHRRVDMSASQVNSLSEQSKKIIDGISGDLEMEAFVEGGRDSVLEELLDAYRYENPHVKIRFVDPQVQPQLAQEAGVSQVPTVRLKLGDQTTLVTKADEESITNGIHRISSSGRKKIYFVDGHGEPDIDDRQAPGGVGLFADALRHQNYDVAKLFLPDVQAVPDDAAVVVLMSGKKDYFEHELDILGDYARKGGRLLVLLEPRQSSDLVKFVSQWGVDVGDNVIVDQQIRLFAGPTLGLDPVVSHYGDHPAVAKFHQRTLFSLARSAAPAATLPKGIVAKGIAYTAKTSWAESDLSRLFDKSEAEFSKTDDIAGPVAIATAASAYVRDIGGKGDAEFEMAVVGDTTFATNKYWQQLFNDAFALSVVGWLAGEEALVSIGPRAIRASRAYLSAAQARSVFYLSVLVIPELILFCGIAVWWRRSTL